MPKQSIDLQISGPVFIPFSFILCDTRPFANRSEAIRHRTRNLNTFVSCLQVG